ncbi:MAG: hypothetical protein EKK57_06660 [Proteobacteria bacterium]|nr:MAG: hypothetical protein EKK57_06660 [Pseudomonadota bacterium]
MNEQTILSNLIHVALFTNFDVGRKFNTAVVKLALEGENTFDNELLLEIVTATGFNPDVTKQREAVKFVIDNILAKRSAKKPRYVPTELSGKWRHWAVDRTGHAFYYKEVPKKHTACWDVQFGSQFKRDTNFHSEDYPEMFEDDNWEQTLQTWEGPEDYVPVFSGEYLEWAIDKCGDAYYYELITDQTSTTWAGNVMTYDTKFDKEKFEHMWRNGVWKTSKITK